MIPRRRHGEEPLFQPLIQGKCPTCKGTQKFEGKTCPTCNGTGEHKTSRREFDEVKLRD